MSATDPDHDSDPRSIVDAAPPRGGMRRFVATVLKVVLPLAIVAGGGGLALGLVETGPEAKRKPPVRQAKLVDVAAVEFRRTTVTIRAMGTVQPDRQVDLQPRVSGQVVWLSDEYVTGGILNAGDRLLGIDPQDYRLVVRQRAADVAKAESDIKIEQGQQSIARREFELLGETVSAADSELVLRKPQLAAVEADLETARSALAQARLDLARTTVTVPFNAVIKSREVNLGTQVTTSNAVATLIGTDSYLIEVAVPVDQLHWISIPRRTGETGSQVRVFNEAAWGPDTFRTGRVVRLAGELESEGRMARLLVAVADPLALEEANAAKPALLIGSYVRVAIHGRAVGPVAVVERRLVRDGNNAWVLTAAGRLEIRPLDILFRGPREVLVESGLEPGERVVTTALSAPVEGMALRTRDQAVSPGKRGRKAGGGGGGRS